MKSAAILLVALVLAGRSDTKLAPSREQRVFAASSSANKIQISGPSIYKFAYDSDLIARQAAALKQRKNDRRLPSETKTPPPTSTLASSSSTNDKHARLPPTGNSLFDDDDNNTEVYSLQKALKMPTDGLSWRNGSSFSTPGRPNQQHIHQFEPILVKSDVKVRSNLLLVEPASEDPTLRLDLIAPTGSTRAEPTRISIPASLVSDLTKDGLTSQQAIDDAASLTPKAAEPVAQVRLISASGRNSPALTINSRGLITMVKNKPGMRLNTSLLSNQMDHSLTPIGTMRPSSLHPALNDSHGDSGDGNNTESNINSMQTSAERPAFLRRPPLVSNNLWRPNSSLVDLDDNSLDEPTNKLRPQALNFDLYPSPASESSKSRFHPNPPYRQAVEQVVTPAPAAPPPPPANAPAFGVATSSTHTSLSTINKNQSTGKQRPKPHRIGMSAPSSARPAEVSPTNSPYEFVSNSTIAPQLNVLGQTGSSHLSSSSSSLQQVNKPGKMINRLQHILLGKLIKNQLAHASPVQAQTTQASTPPPVATGTPAPLLSSTVAHNVASLLAQKLNLFGRPSSLFGLRAPGRPKEGLGAVLMGPSQLVSNRRTAGVGSLLVSGFIYGLSMLPALMALTGINPLAATSQASAAPSSRGSGERKLRRPLDHGSSIAYLVPLVAAGSLEPDQSELIEPAISHEAQPSVVQALYASPPAILEPASLLESPSVLDATGFAAPSRKLRDISTNRAAASSAERENWSMLDANLAGFKLRQASRKPSDERRQLGDSRIDMGKLLASWPISPLNYAGASVSSLNRGYNANSNATNSSNNNNRLSQSDLASLPFVFESRGPPRAQVPLAFGGKRSAGVTHYRQHWSGMTPSEQHFNYLASSSTKANQLLAGDHPQRQQVLANQVGAGTSLVHPSEQRPIKRHRKYLQANAAKLSIPAPIELEPTEDSVFVVGPYQPPPIKNHSSGHHAIMTPSAARLPWLADDDDSRKSIGSRAPVRMATADDNLKVTFALDNDPVFLPASYLATSGAREKAAGSSQGSKWDAVEAAPMVLSQLGSGSRGSQASSMKPAPLAAQMGSGESTKKSKSNKNKKRRKKKKDKDKDKGKDGSSVTGGEEAEQPQEESLVVTGDSQDGHGADRLSWQTNTTQSPKSPPTVDFDQTDDESELLLAHSMAMGTRMLNEPLTGDHL